MITQKIAPMDRAVYFLSCIDTNPISLATSYKGPHYISYRGVATQLQAHTHCGCTISTVQYHLYPSPCAYN